MVNFRMFAYPLRDSRGPQEHLLPLYLAVCVNAFWKHQEGCPARDTGSIKYLVPLAFIGNMRWAGVWGDSEKDSTIWPGICHTAKEC